MPDDSAHRLLECDCCGKTGKAIQKAHLSEECRSLVPAHHHILICSVVDTECHLSIENVIHRELEFPFSEDNLTLLEFLPLIFISYEKRIAQDESREEIFRRDEGFPADST